ncbi:hypothetical protein BGZ49_001095 [Haplosporangium sp. Z 27]|nr:hypothetical protein BGZ49_001095 [Haplosporangium sp. Z 27]
MLTHLELSSPRTITPFDLDELFFNCPPTLESLKFFAQIRSTRGCIVGDEDVSDNDPKVFEFPDPIPREEPLYKLKELRLPVVCSPKGYDETSITNILKHCPVLEHWTGIDFGDYDVGDAAGNALSLYCRNIRHVIVPAQFYCRNTIGLPMTLWDLPHNQIETFYWDELDALDGYETGNILPQFLYSHSQSLRDIRFEKIYGIEGVTISAILSTCVSLEVFVLVQVENKCKITPEELVASEWVCQNLQHLELFLEIQKDEGSNQSDLENKDALGQLYQQIGQMTKLRILDLKRQDTYSELSYRDVLLPRLLTLDDNEFGAKGCLSALASLTELRELRGSFIEDTSSEYRVMGHLEVQWIAYNWPRLKVAEFLPDGYDKIPHFEVPVHIQWLKIQKPDLRLSCESTNFDL